MKISQLKTRKPFNDLFAIDNNVLLAIQEDMQVNGFDKSKPINIWKGVVIDGHTRLKASKNVGIEDVPVFEHKFKDEQEALEYAIRNQRNRRNLSQEELIKCIRLVDKRKSWGGERSKTSWEVLKPKTATKTAQIVGTSHATVERVRAVYDSGDKEIKKQMEAGEISIKKAYEETRLRKSETDKAKSKFNRTNENIEWASWSWNPVVGCKHGCKYCYARDIANRFYGNFEPRFLPERLECPKNTNVPKSDNQGDKSVFVCSMADLFGAWVPQEWIDKVLEAVRNSPQWNYIFLTKNPERLVGIDFPKNAWVGTTVDTQARVERVEKAFKNVKAVVKFVSCEPLLEPVKFSELELFQWVIIGGQSENSQCPAFQPQWEWVESLVNQARRAGCMIYFKPNLLTRPKEYPRN